MFFKFFGGVHHQRMSNQRTSTPAPKPWLVLKKLLANFEVVTYLSDVLVKT